jgi:hypothetical protein
MRTRNTSSASRNGCGGLQHKTPAFAEDRMTNESDTEWFLKDEDGTIGPLSEGDMRKHVERSTDEALLIRQGTSDWRSVNVIRKKICQLQKNGIFIRYKKVAEGPFTLTRAHHVLKCMTPGGIEVRTGAKGQWVPADKWLSKIDKLLQVESKEMDSLSVAVQHVLGRKGFVGPAQTSGELDLADADKDVVAAPAEPETAIEQPLWLGPEPIIEAEAVPYAEPIIAAEPVVEAEVIRAPRWQQSGGQRLHTEPVIEVVKMMHTAEIAERISGKAISKAVPPAVPASVGRRGSAKAPGTKSDAGIEKAVGTSPVETTIRVRPRNHTSRTNRTRTHQEKMVIVGLASAVVIVLGIAGWKWLAETGNTVAASETPSNLQPTLALPTTENKEPSVPGTSPTEASDVPQAPVVGADTNSTEKPTQKPATGDQLGIQTEASSKSQRQQDIASQTSPSGEATKAAPTDLGPRTHKSKRVPLVLSTGTLFHPRFGTSEGEVNAGTAFAAKLTGKSQILILSALHLFGPAGGLKSNIEPDKLTTVWKKLVVEDCKTQNYFGEIQMQPINLSGAKPHPQKSDLGDIAACKVNDPTAIEALPLSQRVPSNGEHVWLVSKLPGSRELIHPATVEQLDNGWLRYSFVNRDIDMRSTGGAPIIDHKGKVVAVNANITQRSGKTIGYGTPVVNFYPTLATLVQ